MNLSHLPTSLSLWSDLLRYLFVLCLLPMLLFSNEVEQRFIDAGLIDVQTVDSTLLVMLVNSNRHNNIFRKDLYGGLEKAYLQKEVALKLKRAQAILKKRYPSYSLCILDAARPRSVSRIMYETLRFTQFKKFVANPTSGSMHNYGIAVDISIHNGERLLDMGPTPFFKSRLKIKLMYLRKQKGKKPSAEQLKNCKVLSTVMKEAGFYPLSFEWWHFNGLKKATARRTYKIIE